MPHHPDSSPLGRLGCPIDGDPACTSSSFPFAESSISHPSDIFTDTTTLPLDPSQTDISEPSTTSTPVPVPVGISITASPSFSVFSDTSTALGSSSTDTTTPSAFAQGSITKSSTNVGAIVGGVIGGAILVLVVLLILLRKPLVKQIRRIRRKRTAPSAEFANMSPQLYSSQSRLASMSPAPRHYRGNSTFSVRDIQGMSDSPVDEEQPPPFTPGTFNDPVIEKVASAARQREMFLQAHGTSPTQEPREDEAMSLQYSPYVLPHPLENAGSYPLDTSFFPATSPILSSEDHATMAGPSRSATVYGGHRSPRSAEQSGWAM